MEKLLELYKIFVESYAEQVNNLEKLQKEAKIENPHVGWSPSGALNSRMFTYDEYLTNKFNHGFCYKEKNQIMPDMIAFLAEFEKKTEDERNEFEKLKPKDAYQKQIEELYLDKVPFIKFLELKLEELKGLESRQEIPFPPKRVSATRQMVHYREARIMYEESIESIDRCRKEITERIKLYNHLLQE